MFIWLFIEALVYLPLLWVKFIFSRSAFAFNMEQKIKQTIFTVKYLVSVCCKLSEMKLFSCSKSGIAGTDYCKSCLTIHWTVYQQRERKNTSSYVLKDYSQFIPRFIQPNIPAWSRLHIGQTEENEDVLNNSSQRSCYFQQK